MKQESRGARLKAGFAAGLETFDGPSIRRAIPLIAGQEDLTWGS